MNVKRFAPICVAVMLAMVVGAVAHAQMSADISLSGRRAYLRDSLSGRGPATKHSLSGALPASEMRLFRRGPASKTRLSSRGVGRAPLTSRKPNISLKLGDQFPSPKYD